MRRRVALALLACVLLAGRASAHAQTPTAAPGDAVLRGSVTMLTAGEPLGADASVEVIVLEDSEVSGSLSAPVVDGRYELTVASGANRTYVPTLTYQGVQYFAEPAVIASGAEDTVRDFEVYASTSEAPDLSISLTMVTVLAVDAAAGQLGLVREDIVANPSDRAYVGGDDRVTFRIPAPDGTIDAAGENPDGETQFEGGIVTTTSPLRAATESSIVTRFLVQYDAAEDEYTLRVTAPLGTQRMVVRVPEGYTRDLNPQGEAARGEDEPFQIGDGEPLTMRTVVLDGVEPGESLVVVLDGFTRETNNNPLAGGATTAIAAVVAVLAVAGAAALAIARRRNEAA